MRVRDFTKQVAAFSYPSDVVRAFTCGDCWLLALELARLNKNLTLVTVSEDMKKGDWHHVAVELPDGLIVDIEGIWGEKAWLDRWSFSWSHDLFVGTWKYPSNLRRSIEERYRRQVFEFSPTEYANSILDRLRTMPEYAKLFS